MSLAYPILTLLLLAAPLTVISSGLFSLGLITLAVALLLTIIALQIRTVEINFLAPIIYPVAIFAAIPALWMLFQILPLKAIGLANPIWESAATALGRSIGGSVSIDTGATIVALVRYLSMIAVSLAAAAVATDRHRAEGLLSVLTASATAIALMKLTTVLDLRDAATVCSVLGVILAATGIACVMERRRMRGENRRNSVVWFGLSFAGYFVALAICLLAIPAATDSQNSLRSRLRRRDVHRRNRYSQISHGTVGIFCNHRGRIGRRRRCDYLPTRDKDVRVDARICLAGASIAGHAYAAHFVGNRLGRHRRRNLCGSIADLSGFRRNNERH